VIRTHERNKSQDQQRTSLHRLLQYVWINSAFYRDYYRSHGIRQQDLRDVATSDLPILSKATLMENFNRAVTDPRLNKVGIEQWLHHNPDPHERFAGNFVVVHSSGSSGNIAVFVYDEKSWRLADFAMARRMPVPDTGLNAVRAAFYAAAHGHFAMVSIATSMQKPRYDTLILSSLDSRENVVQQLNTFKPERLYGYASTITELATLALKGRLHIQPTWISVAGDKLTASMEATIRSAWPATITVTYGASESKYIAVKQAGDDEMAVLDELNVVEVLDANHRPVRSGQEGRVVLTNLYNYILPIIRYEFDDYAVLGEEDCGTAMTICDIKGRVNDALPVVLRGGKHDTIHPMVLTEFHVPQLERIQFTSKSARHVSIQYVAPVDMDAAVEGKFQRILDSKGAVETTFDVHRVQDIPNDSATGKLRLVKIDAPNEINFAPSPPVNDVRELKRAARPGVHTMFEEQARHRPDSVAITCENEALTYSQLNARANQLAHHLRDLGVKPGTLVGICVWRSVHMAVGILGILKAGGAWVPVDEAYPAERQLQVLKDARLSILITEEPIACKLPANSIETVLLDRDWNSISACSTSNPQTVLSSATLAYVMYTSGSTGSPKGVMINHGNLSHYVHAMRQRLGILETDVYLHTASIAFSSSVRQLMLPLTCGAGVVVAKAKHIRQPLSLFALIRDHHVSVMDIVPSYWRTCIDALSELDKRTRENLLSNRLRLILTASEMLSPGLPERWRFNIAHPARLINMFGQTETTGIVATYTIPETGNPDSKSVPIGHPISDTHIYVLDDCLNEVPAGSVGELYVAGPGVGVGYVNQPDISAQRFLHNGVERIYKTGDLGRYRPDGTLEIVGRVDHQVKIRGIRVELQEIEIALNAHPDIRENVVIARQDDPNNKSLVGYVVPASGSALSIEAMRSFLGKKLPEVMVPSAWVMMDSLPRLPNGKLDRLNLPAPPQARSHLEHSLVAPRNSTERDLAKIWQAVLGVAGIGVMDNFFDLGGDSPAALCILEHVGKVFGKNLPPTALFHAPTIERMAELLSIDRPVAAQLMFPLQKRGSKPPFFWIHGDISNAFLPNYLGPDQPVYAIEHQSQDGTPARFTTVENIASSYLREIRAVQPSGPYFLGGFCVGGLVAFEIAQQLKAQGDEVCLVAVVEPSALRNCGSTPSLAIPSVAKTIRGRISESVRTSSIAKFVKHALCVIHHGLRQPIPYSLRSFYILGVYRRAMKKYVVRAYPGSVTLFLHPSTPAESSPKNWSAIATGSVEIHQIPAGQEKILNEPYVQIWAEKLKTCLDDALASHSSRSAEQARVLL